MGKMIYLLMSVILTQLAMILVFDVGNPVTSVYSFWSNLNNWDNLAFEDLASSVILSVGAVAFIGTLVFKPDLAVFAVIATVFLSFGAQLIPAWQIIASQPIFASATEISMAQAGTLTYYGISSIIASLIVGTQALLYLLTVYEFWRNKD